MKVLFTFGGMPHYLVSLLNKLTIKYNIDIVVVRPLNSGKTIGKAVNQSDTGANFKTVFANEYNAFFNKPYFKDFYQIINSEKPDIIVCGYTAYPRIIDFKKFAEIADKVGALKGSPTYLLADVSHIAGLIVGGAHPSPVPYADIVTTTTHKTLRGPRGALIMVTDRGLKKDPDLGKKIDTAIIPGLQGGPHDNQTAAIAVALKEAATPAFKKYSAQIVKNSQKLAAELTKYDFNLVSGGSDNHLLLIDLRNKNVNGVVAALALEVADIVLNKNGVPNDTNPPFYPSGIRLGTPAITTRGMKEKEMVKIAKWINEAVEAVKSYQLPKDKEARKEFMKKFKSEVAKNKKLLAIAKEVRAMTIKFPTP